MRELKFRAWDGEAMRYGGFSIHATAGRVEPVRGLSTVTPESPVMQSVGLKDKNGKEIYEGDIVQTYHSEHTKGEICQIKYLGRNFCMAWDKDDTEMDCVWFYISEVVGNIYENPELLNSP